MPIFKIKYVQEFEAENALEAAKLTQEEIIEQETQIYIVQNSETNETFFVDLLDEGEEVTKTHENVFNDNELFSN